MNANTFNLLLKKLHEILQYRLKEDYTEWTLKTYSYIIRDLCITIETLKYYQYEIVTQDEGAKDE